MISLNKILLESVKLGKNDIIIKNKRDMSQKDIFNQIRAIPNVVTCTPVLDKYLDNRKTDFDEFALVKLKFIYSSTPEETLKTIKHQALHGSENTKKVEGLLQFIIRPKTFHQL